MLKRGLILLVAMVLVATTPAILLMKAGVTLPLWVSANLGNLLYLLAALGLILCWFFYNSREFLLLLLLWAAVFALELGIWQSRLTDPQQRILFDLVAILLPLNFLLVNFLAERGLWNRYGLRRLVVLALQCGVITWLVLKTPVSLATWLAYSPLPWSIPFKTPFNQFALIGMALSVGLLLVTNILRARHLQTGHLLALVAVIAGLHFFSGAQLSLLYFILAVLILIVVTVIHAYNLAYRDELTRLPSRRALRQQLLALGKTYALAMVDVDHFKKLNDNHGHDVGDDVLKLLATHLQRVSGGGKAFRYGGEEFTIVFPGKSTSEAKVYLDALRETIANTPFIVRHKKRPKKKPEKRTKHAGTRQLNVTVSIGVAGKSPEHKSTQDVIKSADNALYKAKKAGRNRVAVG